MNKEQEIVFNQGFVCAVTQLVSMYDQPSMAQEILKSAGHIKWSTIDEADKDVLIKAGIK